ncbi:MAG: carbohydrate binding family 9 domain-containing protein [Saprospiraceae bacterium]|nr:carbohydrate binding family 9 domain-containing protein [Saprospiraceae bacterium]MCB9319821.1 carbohydrate binding family 9 domain-containing protein [Lewinellaceae bacterium]
MRFSFRMVIVGILIVVIAGSQSLYSQSQAIFTHKIDQELVLDGKLDEPFWQEVDVAGNFWQYFPADTIRSINNTEVRLAYDDENIYLGAIMYHPAGAAQKYVTPSLRRDYRGEANDGITMVIDPFEDQTNAYQFGVNPFGVQREGLISEGGSTQNSLSLSWDNKWYSESYIGDGYWSAEMIIPFKVIRFPGGIKSWNVNFYRIDSETGERSSWAHIPKQMRIISLAFSGELIWEIPPVPQNGNISLIPYVLLGTTRDFETEDAYQKDFNIGGDAKIGLGPSLNLDLTINPDFSQVEVDQQVTNLDRFEIFFPERRQFFLENGDLFANFGTNRIRPFFSRRIGIALDEANDENVPNPIYGGARLSGKLNENLRLGLLSMQAAHDVGIQLPSTNYSVLALQQKIFARSNIGLIAINKSPFKDQALPDPTDSLFHANRLVGMDYNLATKDDRWNGKLFFHRSFDHGVNDHAAAVGASITYNQLWWEVEAALSQVGANFNPEVGYVRRTDYTQSTFTAYRNFYPQKGIINQHSVGIDYDLLGNAANGLTDYDVNILYRISFQNTSRFMLRLRHQYVYLTDSFDPTNTEGAELPAGTAYPNNLIIASYMSDMRNRFSFEFMTRSGEFWNGTRLNLDGNIAYRFQPKGSVGIDFSVNQIRLPNPYNDANFFLIGPKFDFTFTRNLFWTTFIQYNNQIDNLNVNSRFQWRFKPVSDLFLVYTDNYYPSSFSVKSRALVFKLTYWLNV